MNTEKNISFISDRKHYDIPESSILYVSMKKQDAFIHISDGSVLKTRMTFAELKDTLSANFIRINRGCLVSAMAIHSVGKLIILSNGESLEYATQHRREIMEKFHMKQHFIIDSLADNDNPTDKEEYHQHYKCFDNIPIAFTDIEMIFNKESQAVDWIFRYGNEAFARLEGFPLDALIGKSFGSIYSNMDSKWLRSYEHSVLYGETLEIVDYSPEVDKYLRIVCFSTFKGHCGCLMFDISETNFSVEKTVGEKAILMYLKKLME